MNGNMTRQPGRLMFAALTPVLVVALAACSSPSSTARHPAHPRAASAAPRVTTQAASGLSGIWSGQYSGAYNGTFTLKWRQSGSHLNGRIMISSPARTLAIHGTVNGSAIRFGTVGSAAITYSGTVSGNSMSGTYQVNGSSGGPWNASKA